MFHASTRECSERTHTESLCRKLRRVNLLDLLSRDSRVLDVGATNDRMAAELSRSGIDRYLALVDPSTLGQIRSQSPRFERRIQPLHSTAQVVNSSTDVIVLRSAFAQLSWGLRDLRGVRYVAVEVGSLSTSFEVWASQFLGRRSGSVTSKKVWATADGKFDVLELSGSPHHRARHYLSEVLGVEGLIRRLNEAGICYAVLRWFESLPILAPGEDLDILVADGDLTAFRDILAEEPGTIPVDLYSESGADGSDYSGIAYYPPLLARRILAGAVKHTSGGLVPGPTDHLNSLAYHALYHKGDRCGIASRVVTAVADAEHDYAAVLTELASQQGLDFEMTMEDLDHHLLREGWQPPLDTLRRLSDNNTWIRDYFFAARQGRADLPELAVFFVREATLDVLDLSDVLVELDNLEFEILLVRDLDVDARELCARIVRGGNWGRGPYPVSGGVPVAVIVAAHYGPRVPPPALLDQYPRLTNSDVLLAKNELREKVRRRVGDAGVFNPVHSADDELEAWEYVKAAAPSSVSELEDALRRRKSAYRTDQRVTEVLSLGRRAKVEVLNGTAAPVVRKTFAFHSLRYLRRELDGIDYLSPHVDAIPCVLERGSNWFAMPLYRNQLDIADHPNGSLIPLRHVHQMVRILRQVHEHGADLIDAKPQNFILDPDEGLKVIDLEFYYRYGAAKPAFEENYSFTGAPIGFEGDIPYGEVSYDLRWRPFVGLSLESLLHDPVWLQHLKRTWHRFGMVLRLPIRLARLLRRRVRELIRRLRRSSGNRYRVWATERAHRAG